MAHVYDVTYGVVKPTDNLVIIDDSIVRGTTLKKEYFTHVGPSTTQTRLWLCPLLLKYGILIVMELIWPDWKVLLLLDAALALAKDNGTVRNYERFIINVKHNLSLEDAEVKHC